MQDIIEKLKQGDEITTEEKEMIIQRVKKQDLGYGIAWENHPEEIELLRDTHSIQVEELTNFAIQGNQGQDNILLEGDNLHSLEYLQNQQEKVDLIYIDPPYNTLNQRGFTYNDSMKSQGDKHSKWLSFMSKRLKIARELLKDEGVVFISIDENEVAQLKLLCDSIFGEEHYITQFAWVSTSKSIEELEETEKIKTLGANLGMFKNSYEYILSYRKTKEFKFNLVESDQTEIKSRITKKGNNQSVLVIPKGTRCEIEKANFKDYVGGISEQIEIFTEEGIVIEEYTLQNDIEIKGPFANPLMVRDYFEGKDVIDNRGQKLKEVYLTRTGIPYMLKEKKGDLVSNVLSGYGDTSKWARELDEMLGRVDVFAHPKPHTLIQDLIKLHPRKDIIVLDYFAGSGTTGQAVMELNKKDKGTRKFILCTNNEYQEIRKVDIIHQRTQVCIDLKNNGGISKKGLEQLRVFEGTEEHKHLKEKGCFEEIGICRSVTYPRIKSVIEGYTTSKGLEVKGIQNNLEYKKVTLERNKK